MSEEKFYTQTDLLEKETTPEVDNTEILNHLNKFNDLPELKEVEDENKNEEPVVTEVNNDEIEVVEEPEKEVEQPMPIVSKPEYKPQGEDKFKTFLKTAFSLHYLPVVLCAIATFFMVFARFFETIAYSNGSQGCAKAYLAFNFIGFLVIAGALITYVVNACLKKKLEFGPTLFILLVCVFAFV